MVCLIQLYESASEPPNKLYLNETGIQSPEREECGVQTDRQTKPLSISIHKQPHRHERTHHHSQKGVNLAAPRQMPLSRTGILARGYLARCYLYCCNFSPRCSVVTLLFESVVNYSYIGIYTAPKCGLKLCAFVPVYVI